MILHKNKVMNINISFLNLLILFTKGYIIFPPSVPDPFPLLRIIEELEAKVLAKDQTIELLRENVSKADKSSEEIIQKMKDELASTQQEVKRLQEASLVKSTKQTKVYSFCCCCCCCFCLISYKE